MTVTFTDLENLWAQAGGDPSWAPMAAGIAEAESSGDPTSANTTDPAGGSYGLWQINGVHAPGGTATPDWVTQIEDPLANAQEAVALSGGGTNWQPWTGDRLWTQWVAAGRPQDPDAATVQEWLAAAGAPSGGGANAPATLTSGSPGIFGFLTNPAGSLWQEVQPFLVEALLVLFGLGLVVIGAYRLAKPEADRAMETAGKAVPLAEVAAA